MFGTVWHFLRQYVAPQWGRILLNLQMPVCIAIAWLIASQPYALERVMSESVVAQMVNYNFMAFGFTIAALTITFAVPTTRFQEYMFERAARNPEKGQGPWEDALFIMAWNGFVHFVGLATAVFALANCFNSSSGDVKSVFAFDGSPNTLIFGVFIALQLYAVSQFLMTLLSSYFFCASYVRHSRRAWEKRRNPTTAPS